jgi:hypothetical protein
MHAQTSGGEAKQRQLFFSELNDFSQADFLFGDSAMRGATVGTWAWQRVGLLEIIFRLRPPDWPSSGAASPYFAQSMDFPDVSGPRCTVKWWAV